MTVGEDIDKLDHHGPVRIAWLLGLSIRMCADVAQRVQTDSLIHRAQRQLQQLLAAAALVPRLRELHHPLAPLPEVVRGPSALSLGRPAAWPLRPTLPELARCRTVAAP